MSFTVIIPARYQATRFPGKLLASLAGKTVLEHTWDVARRSLARQVIIALDDVRLENAARSFDASLCITDTNLASGTDRVYQAAEKFGCQEQEIIINLQGDEPCFHHEDINALADELQRTDAPMATVMRRFVSGEKVDNPNMVKVVTDKDSHALYFSRSPIPYNRTPSDHFLHLGVYAFRMHFLRTFVSWQCTGLEQTEQLEQLRALANGVKIRVIESQHVHPGGIDTPQDLARLEKYLQRQKTRTRIHEKNSGQTYT